MIVNWCINIIADTLLEVKIVLNICITKIANIIQLLCLERKITGDTYMPRNCISCFTEDIWKY